MNLRSKKTIVPAGLVAAALVIGGTAWAASGDDLSDSDRDRATKAALAEVGEGTVTETSAGDDRDDPAFEVEITRRDGSEVEVALDETFAVLYVDDDRAGSAGSDDTEGTSAPATEPTSSSSASAPQRDSDDVALTGDTKSKAEAAAVKAVGGGTALASEKDADDDGDRAIYEVDVRATDGTLWKVELDKAFALVEKEIED